jgi:Leucine-rich repeat (LRR) protein
MIRLEHQVHKHPAQELIIMTKNVYTFVWNVFDCLYNLLILFFEKINNKNLLRNSETGGKNLMNFPVVISRLVGYYAVTSIYDLELLLCSGFLKPHDQALQYTSLQFQHLAQALRAISQPMFGGLRTIKLEEATDDESLKHLTEIAPNLEELDLGQCKGVMHTYILGGLRKLRKLRMSYCSSYRGFLTDTLRELELTHCATLHGDVGCLAHLTAERNVGRLTHLTLDSCTIDQSFKLNDTLTHLVLRANCFTNFEWDPDTLDGLTNLKSLEITESSIDNIQALAITTMTRLETLTLKRCPFLTDYRFLEGLHLLRSLHVETSFDWSMLKHLKLHLFSVREYHNSDLRHLVTQPDLRCLRLDQARSPCGDTAEVLSTLIAGWTHLRTLDLFYCTHLLTTHGFPVCPTVTCLKIDFCKLIDDSKLQALMRSFPNLEILSANFTQVSDSGLACLHGRFRELNFRGCNLTSAALVYFKPMRELTSLDIAYTKVQKVNALPKSLQVIDVTGCNLVCTTSTRKLLRYRRTKVIQSF